MKRKDIARLFDPTQHIYSKAWLDPYRPTPDRPLGPLALHNEIRRRLLAGEAVDNIELARNYAVDEVIADRAIYYEEGRFSEYDRTLGVELTKEVNRLLKEKKQIYPYRLSNKFGMSRYNTKRIIAQEKAKFVAANQWQKKIKELIHEVALNQQYFTADDVFLLMVEDKTTDPRGIGKLMLSASKKGICEKTDQYVKTRRRSNRRRLIAVWRSLIHQSQGKEEAA